MSSEPRSTPSLSPVGQKPPGSEYVDERYEKQIAYYGKKALNNASWYKRTRFLTIILGAVLTLIASLSAGSLVDAIPILDFTIKIATPILAAVLSIVAGFSQTFQWGNAWQEMSLTQAKLQENYDRYRTSPEDQRDPKRELERINELVFQETASFFDRLMGRSAGNAAPPNRSEHG